MIRLATVADSYALASLEQQCFGEHGWTADMLISEINNTYSTVVAYTNTEGDIVGYLSARVASSVVEISNIAVAVNSRRQGIARQLLEFLHNMHVYTCDSVMLEVSIDNSSAVALYNSCGYITVATRHNFYAEGRYASRDAYTMIHTLQ